MAAITFNREQACAWAALLYTLAIFLSSGVMRGIQTALREGLGAAFGPTVTLLLLGVLAGVLGYCRRASISINGRLLMPVLLGYAGALWLLPVAEERIHLLQYGVLNVLVYGALRGRLHGFGCHLVTVLLVTLAGAGDEYVQHLRPNRVGDWGDVVLNAVSALLAQGVILSLSPAKAVGRPGPRGGP